MKQIIIEQVANGWMVRPVNPQQGWTVDNSVISVYRSIRELQDALPELLGPIKASELKQHCDDIRAYHQTNIREVFDPHKETIIANDQGKTF